MLTIAGRRVRLGLTFKILLAADIALDIFIVYVMVFVVPGMEKSVAAEREGRVTQLTLAASNVLEFNYGLEISGVVTREEAQARAIAEVNGLTEGSGGQNDLWVCDSQPVLLAGNSLPDRVNTNVGDITDADGKAVFTEMAAVAGSGGEGVYRYSWQSTPGAGGEASISYVKSFEPWGWTVSSGTSIQDVTGIVGTRRWTVGWMAGLTGLIGIIIFWLVVRVTVLKPISSLVKTSEALAVGDVDQRVEIRSNDEIGDVAAAYNKVVDYMKQMADTNSKIADGDLTVPITPRSEKDVLSHSFSRMVARQRELISDIMGAAANVAGASESLSQSSEQAARAAQQIASTVQQVARGTAEQSASLQTIMANEQQLARAIEQMASASEEQAASAEEAARMISQVSESASQVLQNAHAGTVAWESTAKTAQAGARTTHETVEGMKKIKEAIDVVSVKVTDLGQRSREIGGIVETIDDIAAQTNLLALNAAIEAARAGDQGRGFAVVADEVRKLAERSSIATKEIAVLIRSIQSGVSDAASAMEKGSREVQSGYGLAGQAGQALDDILQSSQSVGQQVTQITAAAEELSVLSRNMVTVIHQISRTIEENASAAEAMAHNSTTVSGSIETIGSVSEENSASAEEVSASVEEMSAGAEEVSAAAHTLAEMSVDLKDSVAAFKTDE